MVEITYQMVLSTLQTAGILIGIFYYIMTLRNSTRNQQFMAETRRAQLLNDVMKDLQNYENQLCAIELQDMEWDDYDDFERKYGSANNPDSYAKRMSHLAMYLRIGVLIQDGLIDAESVYEVLNLIPVWFWEKWGPIIQEQRKVYNLTYWFKGFEHLNNEMIRVHEKRGHEVRVPEQYHRYHKEM